ncbi:MAG: 30S ribosomal protein S2 [Puniceicoccales bacterium]|jgi:small subunit ribosomal protein S2|nr:30S ribosomal protein S2 [Puniceicoccales bacterium]
MEISYEDMLEAGVHFGHQQKRWNPKFGPYLYQHLHRISIIDLERTRECLEAACRFLSEEVKKGSTVLFVGTKRPAQGIVRETAKAVSMPFCVDRWLGGCLTNFETIRRSLAKYSRFRAMEESGELAKMLKKEASVIRREMTRMHRGFEGIQELNRLPDILFVVDVNTEIIAVREARRLNIPVVAIVDTNSDPTLVRYPIPANDDSTRSLQLLMESVQAAIGQGLEYRNRDQARKEILTLPQRSESRQNRATVSEVPAAEATDVGA